MTDLQALKKELADKLMAVKQAEALTILAEREYTERLEKFLALSDNAAIKTDMEKRQDALAKAKQDWKDTRANAAISLSDYFDEHPEDKDKEPAFSFRREKKPLWSCGKDRRIKSIIQAGATFLLQVDEKAVTAFVKNMAVENEDHFMLPVGIRTWLPELSVDIEIKPTISDKKLKD
jgi:hypothetical protein